MAIKTPPELPAKSSLASTDIFIVDDGEHTYKITYAALLNILAAVSGFTANNNGSLTITLSNGTELTAKPSDPDKQDVLTFDSTPTANSNNPVKSGGVYSADQALSAAIAAEAARAGDQESQLALDVASAAAAASSASSAASTAQSTADGAAAAVVTEKGRAETAENALQTSLNKLGLSVVNGRLCVTYSN